MLRGTTFGWGQTQIFHGLPTEEALIQQELQVSEGKES